MTTWYEQYLASWETLDAARVLDFFVEDCVFEDTTIGRGAQGKRQLRRFIEASFANVPNATFEFVRGHDNGEDYAIEWVMQPMNVRGVSVGQLRDGRIAVHRDYWNGAAFAGSDERLPAAMTAGISDADKLALAAVFSRATSANDADALRALCAPGAVTWHNFDEVEVTTEQTIRAMSWLHRTVPDLAWIDVTTQATTTGWVSQSTLVGTAPGGALRANTCVVVTLDEQGKVVRVAEYLDPIQLAVLRSDKAPQATVEP